MLAFGLSSAPYLFTKLFKPLLRKWRSETKGIVVYLDDGLGSAGGYNNVKIASLQVHAYYSVQVLLRTNPDAFGNRPRLFRGWGQLSIRPLLVLPPPTNGLWVCRMSYSILSVSSFRIPVRKLACVCGKIISLTNCVGNVSRLMTRNLSAFIYLWNFHVHLFSESLTDLTFWRSNVGSLKGTPIWPERNKPSMIIYSDASASAGSSFIIEFEGKFFHQNWSDFEKSQSSTFRELLAVSLSMKSFPLWLRLSRLLSSPIIRMLSVSSTAVPEFLHYRI